LVPVFSAPRFLHGCHMPPCYLSGMPEPVSPAASGSDWRSSTGKHLKLALGWIFGPILALFVVLAVLFFERRLRFEIRRNPAWRSQ